MTGIDVSRRRLGRSNGLVNKHPGTASHSPKGYANASLLPFSEAQPLPSSTVKSSTTYEYCLLASIFNKPEPATVHHHCRRLPSLYLPCPDDCSSSIRTFCWRKGLLKHVESRPRAVGMAMYAFRFMSYRVSSQRLR